jgi:hypothetical protein
MFNKKKGENMNIHKQKPNTNSCEYCGVKFKKNQNTYAGIYCNIECSALRGVRYGYRNLLESEQNINNSDFNGKIFNVNEYENKERA